jgi:lysyl-tRNA synthetase class I
MIDQCLEFGEDCINKAREQHEKELKTRTKFVERFIKQYENPDQTKIAFMDSSMMNDGM